LPPAVARVLPDLAALDRAFDYDATEEEPPLAVGDRVRVALHGRSVRGWVVALAAGTQHGELKRVARRLGLGPPAPVVALCEWAAWRWAGPWSKLLATASPARIVTDTPAVPGEAELPEVHNQLRVTGLRLVRDRAATLVRLGPCTDPLDLVLGVLHGVRSSGATGSVVVTTPTTAWAERLAERLRRRGVAAAGPERWAEARAGFPVVVGARAAALAPVPELAAAVVLDAHDDAYRQTQAPCWSAVGLLAERCRREQAALVATSWCPDPTLLALVARTEPTEHESRMWPRLVVADLRSADPRERTLTSQLAVQAHRALDEPGDGVRVVVVLQRLGGVRLLACRSCGSLAVCEPHARALHDVGEGLGCDLGCQRHPRVCVACGAGSLHAVREGITSLTTRVAALLGVDAAEVSAASVELPDGARVVVGTEAVLTRVRRAPLVCFADLDDYLGAPRAHGSLAALRAIGLAGRLVGARGSAAPGHVLVQTRQPDHLAVTAAVRGDPAALVADERRVAAALSLPPHVAVAALSGPGAPALATTLSALGVTVTEERKTYLAVASSHRVLCDALAAAGRGNDNVRVEVDPPGR
jgi:primosomal protein N' (replication factor Y) (superfamily II helicase)